MGKKEKRKQTKRRKKKGSTIVKAGLLLTFLAVIVLGAVVGTAGYTVYMQTDISSLAARHEPTVIYDRNGNVFEELSNSRVDYVPISAIPQTMRDAIIAIEDTRFKEHVGVDPIGIARAFVKNVLDGDISQGGSTITQQLAKNKFFTMEQTLSRKFKEAVVALKIERELSKDQILEQYLNIIYFGEGAWGIQNAANIYFGKDVEELTLEESALLAALPKAPSHYSPLVDPVKAKQRRDLVLSKMAEYGMVTEDQRAQAASTDIVLAEAVSTKSGTTTSSYADHVIAEAIELTGLTEQEILAGGLHIYTHVDPNMQSAADEVYRQAQYFPEGDPSLLQSGIAMMDSETGGILALVGQRGEKEHYRGFNYATQTRRQPGSSMKPIVAYAPALMDGYRKNDQINDVRTDFSGYTPNNYGGRFHGWVTMEKALVESYNIPAVAMLKEVGIDKGMKLAREAGLPVEDQDRTLGLALGGMENGVSPLQMAQAYTMFANNGVWSEAHAIIEIKNDSGVSIYKANADQKELISPEAAYEMTLMLQKAVNEGTGTNARMNRPVAGKTGTTQLPDIPKFRDANGNVIDGTRDAWFVGYTPDVVGAVWLGYISNDTDQYLSTTGGRYPAQIFKEVMQRALEGEPVKEFDRPAGYKEPSGDIRYINGEPPKKEKDEDKDDKKGKGNKGKGNKDKNNGNNGKGNGKDKDDQRDDDVPGWLEDLFGDLGGNNEDVDSEQVNGTDEENVDPDPDSNTNEGTMPDDTDAAENENGSSETEDRPSGEGESDGSQGEGDLDADGTGEIRNETNDGSIKETDPTTDSSDDGTVDGSEPPLNREEETSGNDVRFFW